MSALDYTYLYTSMPNSSMVWATISPAASYPLWNAWRLHPQDFWRLCLLHPNVSHVDITSWKRSPQFLHFAYQTAKCTQIYSFCTRPFHYWPSCNLNILSKSAMISSLAWFWIQKKLLQYMPSLLRYWYFSSPLR